MKSLFRNVMLNEIEFIAEVLVCKKYPAIIKRKLWNSEHINEYNNNLIYLSMLSQQYSTLLLLQTLLTYFDEINIQNFKHFVQYYTEQQIAELEKRITNLCNKLNDVKHTNKVSIPKPVQMRLKF